MTNKKPDKSADRYRLIPLLIFFTGSVIFFEFFSDHVGFFQEKLSLFIFSSDYLTENIHQPGSLLKYMGLLVTSFFYYRLAAAFIISLVIGLIIYFISRILWFLTGNHHIIVSLVFGASFFFLQSDYQYLLYNNLGILLQLVLFYLIIKYLKGFIPILIFPIWYWVTGGFSWIFGMMYILYLLKGPIKKEWIKISSLLALGFLLIWLPGKYVVFQPVKTLLVFPFSNDDTGMQLRILLSVIFVMAFIPLLAGIKIRKLPWFSRNKISGFYFQSVFSLVLISSLIMWRSDRVLREYFHAEKLFYRNDYTALSQFVTEHPTTNRLTLFLNNIALCETGRLNDILFHFAQSPDGQTLFLKWEMHGEVLRRGGYFYYITGMINEAHRWAYENMVMKGLSPEGLKMLIRTELINGNYKVAAKYISLLKRTLFYRKDALKFENLLFNEDAIISDPDIGVKRKEKIGHDFFSITDDPYVNIEKVLTVDSMNMKAFEYKLAFMLLTEDYNGISVSSPKLAKIGFTRIPVHVEEALLVCRMSESVIKPDPAPLSVDPRTEARFNEFLKTFQLYGNNLRAAQPTLKKKYGDTFWYYAFYH